MLDYVKPSSWVGWTAVILVVILAVVAGMADGAHKMIRAAAWLLVAAVALVAVFNSGKS